MPVVRDIIINQCAPVHQAFQAIHTLNVADNLTSHNVQAIQIAQHHWLALIDVARIHVLDLTFVTVNKPVLFWIHNQFEQFCVNVHRIR